MHLPHRTKPAASPKRASIPLSATSQSLLAAYDQRSLRPRTAPLDYPLAFATLYDFLEYLEVLCKLKVPDQVTKNELSAYTYSFDDADPHDPATFAKLEHVLADFFAFMHRPQTRREVTPMAG